MPRLKLKQTDPKALEIARKQIESMYKGNPMIVDPKTQDVFTQRIDTEVPSLNYIFSGEYFGENAGFAAGKAYNFEGPESIGKSAMALFIAGIYIKNGGTVLWIDKEASFDSIYARKFGVDVDNTEQFILAKPDNAEEAFNILESFLDNGAIHLAVVDSIPALGTEESNDKAAGNSSMATLARALHGHFQRILGVIDKLKTSIIYINQLRSSMATPGNAGTGGWAMKFYPHVKLEFKRTATLEQGTGKTADFLGEEVYIRAKKNKTAMPRLWAILNMYPGEGFSREIDILNLAIKVGICSKAGAWYRYGEEALGQGLEKTRSLLKKDKDLLEKIWLDTMPLLNPDYDPETGELLTPAGE